MQRISSKQLIVRLKYTSDGSVNFYTPQLVSTNDYYAFGQIINARTYSVGGQNYRYGFNGKESTVVDDFDAYDFGARSFDQRLGRWMSTDAHQKTYPGLSPYQYAFNSPNLFNDPDGNDGRITIIPKSDGTGGKIIIESVVYIFGPDAKEKMAETLTQDYSNLLGSVGSFVDVDVKEWTIEINVTYSSKYINELNDYFSNFLNENGQVENPLLSNVPEDLQKQLKDFKNGDNFLFISRKVQSNLGGTSLTDYMAKSNGKSSTSIHETFHLLDFYHTNALEYASNLYADFMDIMEGGGSDAVNVMSQKMIHPVHFQEVLDIANRVFGKEKSEESKKKYSPKNENRINKDRDIQKAEGTKHKVDKKKSSGGNGNKKYTNQKHYKRNPNAKKSSPPVKNSKTKG